MRQLVLSVVLVMFDHGLLQLCHSEMHWLDVPECIQHKLKVTIHRCLQSRAPQYPDAIYCNSSAQSLSNQSITVKKLVTNSIREVTKLSCQHLVSK